MIESVTYRPLGSADAALILFGNEIRGTASEEFRQTVRHLSGQGVRWMVMDLSQIIAVDSMAVGVLLLAYKLCEEKGGEAILLRPSPILLSLLETLAIDQFFRVFADEGEILQSLKDEGIDIALRE